MGSSKIYTYMKTLKITFLWSLWCSIIVHLTLKKDFKHLPCEFRLSRSDARVKRELLRVREPSGASVCSRSVEKSESSVPSELLPAVLWKTTIRRINCHLHCVSSANKVCVFFTSGKFSKDPMLGEEHHWSINSKKKTKKTKNGCIYGCMIIPSMKRNKHKTKHFFLIKLRGCTLESVQRSPSSQSNKKIHRSHAS